MIDADTVADMSRTFNSSSDRNLSNKISSWAFLEIEMGQTRTGCAPCICCGSLNPDYGDARRINHSQKGVQKIEIEGRGEEEAVE